jgi:hypothetical protein
MKKTVILILILLPIVLVITIAFAGQILSMYHHIPVEKVDFVDDVGDSLDDEYLFVVNVGETKSTAIRIFPEMASNKNVAYTVQDESICTVDAEGNIKGVAIGSTTVLVTTSEGNKIDMLNVLVVAEHVTGISLPETELTMKIGEQGRILPTIEPYTALNKNVTFTTSDKSIVSVKSDGKITAHKSGTAVITVITQEGGMTATCTVTVIEGTPPIKLDLTGAPDILNSENGYIVKTSSIDLAPYLQYDAEKIDPTTIHWRVSAGSNVASLTGTTLSFQKMGIVTVTVYVGNEQEPTHSTEIKLFFQP